MSQPARARTTLAEFWAIPEEERFHELIDGELTPKASPSGEHGRAQAGLVGTVHSRFQRKPGGAGGPGGWWISVEIELLLDTGDLVRPDVIGWRRERSPEHPTGTPVRLCPDWVCEILSPSNANHDTIAKLRLYHRVAIPHYWIVDPHAQTLTVMRWSADGYVTRLSAERGETVRAEPFDAIEIAVGTLFGDDPPE
ncbi:MAG: Uma2 family endonuclease [Deltaproteobacteria bacterium]|nr:Uma2 family endonuclease [Deltaproteobacteria bacterium]